MKRLFLLRHAEAVPGDARTDDFDRVLDERGEAAAEAIGREMRRLGLAFDAIVASPAARAWQTVARAADGYGAALPAQADPRAYLAAPTVLLAIVRETADSNETLLMVGHNPGFAMLAGLLAPNSRATEQYPTGALAEIVFEVEHWRDVAPGSGRLVRFVRPIELEH